MKFSIIDIKTSVITKQLQETEFFRGGEMYVRRSYKKLAQPLIGIDVKLRVDMYLMIGCEYFDGKISYRVQSNHYDPAPYSILRNVQSAVEEFKMPSSLIQIYAPAISI